jgi:glycosyltransferase involved in cell wall biosynthesis
MFLLEAMATGLPVVSTNVGSIDEIVEEGKTGFLVESGDHEGMAGRLLSLINDRDALHEMGRRGLERVEENFSIRSMVESFQGLMTDLLDSRSGP